MSDDHRYEYHGDNRGGGGEDRNRGDLASWIPTLIFLICFPPIGVIMLILKLIGVTGKRRGQVGRHPYDLQKEGKGPGEQAQGERSDRPVRPAKGKGRKKRYGQNPGTGLTLGGGIIAGIFGLGALSEFFSALSGGGMMQSLEEIFIPLAFCGAGLCMAYYGVRKTKKAKRVRKYLALIGKGRSISVATLAEAAGQPVRKVCDDLQDMLDDGDFPTGYLDMRAGRLVLSGDGIPDREPETAQPERAEGPSRGMEREETVLSEIREVNDAVADPVMSGKIDRVGEITGKILAFLRERPDKEGQLRGFLSYYLPTTLKILRAYAQMEAQGIDGENITAARHRIEGMMDKVVDGFEKQLDKLFQDDAMDITTDVEVLERMLDKDGLGGGESLTLGG